MKEEVKTEVKAAPVVEMPAEAVTKEPKADEAEAVRPEGEEAVDEAQGETRRRRPRRRRRSGKAAGEMCIRDRPQACLRASEKS